MSEKISWGGNYGAGSRSSDVQGFLLLTCWKSKNPCRLYPFLSFCFIYPFRSFFFLFCILFFLSVLYILLGLFSLCFVSFSMFLYFCFCILLFLCLRLHFIRLNFFPPSFLKESEKQKNLNFHQMMMTTLSVGLFVLTFLFWSNSNNRNGQKIAWITLDLETMWIEFWTSFNEQKKKTPLYLGCNINFQSQKKR